MAVNRFVLNNISYHGSGAIKEIPGELERRGYKKAFVCSDPDLVKFGVVAKVTDLLDEAGIAWELYSEIKPNPTIKNVQDGVEAYKASGADCIVTIGGGSSMDTAKGIGIIVAVPTTAGTAAEVTINYVITDPEKVRKFVCVDVNDIPDVAVVDPDMMASMPAGLTAATGMDALTHAIEGYTTQGAWELSDMFHYKAIQLISKHLRDAVAEARSGVPGSGREGMALAQYIAGMGFSNVGLGIDHAMAHTLSAHYDTPHGVACAMLLPVAMEYNKRGRNLRSYWERPAQTATTRPPTPPSPRCGSSPPTSTSSPRATAWLRRTSTSWPTTPSPTPASRATRARPTTPPSWSCSAR